MNHPENKISAAQARRDYKRSLRAPERQNPDLLPPEVPAIISGDPNGLIEAKSLANPLEVLVPDWFAAARRVLLEWTVEGGNRFVVVEEVADPGLPSFPFPMRIPVDEFVEGRRHIRYRVVLINGENRVSPPTLVTLDRTPPYGVGFPAAPTWPETMPAGALVTDEYLATTGGVLPVFIPEYPDRQPGDTAFFYWLREVPETPEGINYVVGPLDLDVTREVWVPRDVLAATGDGTCYGVYVLKDKAGNISRLSAWIKANVLLGPLPSDLQPPVVPLAADGLIDRLDGFAGVVVNIPAFQGSKNGDLVRVTWGRTELVSYPVGPAPQFPIPVPVPWSALKTSYDFDPQYAEDQPVEVSYQVIRENVEFPAAPLSTTVVVNLRVTGPENGNEPDPVNPKLTEPLIKGESQLDNQLIETDAGKDATATIVLPEGLSSGDMIYLYWDGGLTPSYYDVKTNDVPGQEVTIPIPWSVIEASGNNTALPVHYLITKPGSANHQLSLTRHVRVKIETLTLPKATFPHIFIDEEFDIRSLNCSSLRQVNGNWGVHVHIAAGGKYLKQGVHVTTEWRVYDYDTDEEIEGTADSAVFIITPEQELNGIDWFVQPYEDRLLPSYGTDSHYGWAWVRYRAIVAGEEVPSEITRELLGVVLPGGGTCPLP